jgi:uncharacterized protein YgiM (DUF1202 family)
VQVNVRTIEMNIVQRVRPSSGLVFGVFLAAIMLLMAACQPIVDPALMEEQDTGSATAADTQFEVEPAKATINADSLRVRQGPGDDYEQTASVKQGETYDVVAMSSDGAWIQLAVDSADGGQGWVSTEFVTLEGDITNIATVPAEGSSEEAASADETAATDETASADEMAATDEAASADESATTDETATMEEEATTEESTAADEASSSDEAAANASVIGEALIKTPLPLRVRKEPNDLVENKIGSVYNLETYPVLAISDDGLWVKIDVPKLSDSGGWVWWENVEMSGDAANTPLGGAEAAAAEEANTGETAATEAEVADAASAEEANAAESEASADTGAEEPAAIGEALIQAPLPLRVRSEPSDKVDNKIGNVLDGETYPVLEISEDGLWVKIYVPELSEDGGWVSAEYVVVSQ